MLLNGESHKNYAYHALAKVYMGEGRGVLKVLPPTGSVKSMATSCICP